MWPGINKEAALLSTFPSPGAQPSLCWETVIREKRTLATSKRRLEVEGDTWRNPPRWFEPLSPAVTQRRGMREQMISALCCRSVAAQVYFFLLFHFFFSKGTPATRPPSLKGCL